MDSPIIKGKIIDVQGRCAHWHSDLDIIAIKFACCNEFYACYECHQETAGHPPKRWPQTSFDNEGAILCGSCRSVLTITQYMACESQCPHCNASFNPRCQLHWNLYFEVDP